MGKFKLRYRNIIRKEDFNMFKVGDTVQIINGAVYLNNGRAVADSLLAVKLYVRETKEHSSVVARAKTGPVVGEIDNNHLKLVEGNIALIDPYIIQARDVNIPLYNSPNKNSGIIRRLGLFELITIVDEKNDFGKVKMGAGWIDLSKVVKL
jgi:hypothetical protein